MSSVGHGNPFYTYDMRFKNAMREREADDEIKRLLKIAKNKKLSRRRRRAAYNEALELCESFFGTGFDSSDDSAKDGLGNTTDPGNSSVSPVSEVSSESEGTINDLRERFFLETDADWRHYERFLEEMKSKKIEEKTKRKKAAKLALQLEAAGAEDAAAAEEIKDKRRNYHEQKSRILNAAVKNPFVPENLTILFADLGFVWNPLTLCWTSNSSNHELFKDDPFPSETKILEEIGQVAWTSILKQTCTACHEVEFFLNQIEAEASSEGFLKSFFDSDADDEGDD